MEEKQKNKQRIGGEQRKQRKERQERRRREI
jgi:hypothetical protein